MITIKYGGYNLEQLAALKNALVYGLCDVYESARFLNKDIEEFRPVVRDLQATIKNIDLKIRQYKEPFTEIKHNYDVGHID